MLPALNSLIAGLLSAALRVIRPRRARGQHPYFLNDGVDPEAVIAAYRNLIP